MKAVLVLLLALPVANVRGIQFPEEKTVNGTQLELNGAGVRDIALVKIYAAGIYVEEPGGDARQIIQQDRVKQFRMVMIRRLSKERAAKAFDEGVEKNTTPEGMAMVRSDLDKLLAALPEKLEKGQELVATYVPGKGTTITGPGMNLTFAGKPFADALLAIWLGSDPADKSLKNALVGKR